MTAKKLRVLVSGTALALFAGSSAWATECIAPADAGGG